MALAFARAQPFTALAPMAGGAVEQLESNLEAVDVTLSVELIKSINAIHDSRPNPK